MVNMFSCDVTGAEDMAYIPKRLDVGYELWRSVIVLSTDNIGYYGFRSPKTKKNII